MLFLVYGNDMEVSVSCQLILYADDSFADSFDDSFGDSFGFKRGCRPNGGKA